MEKIAKMEKVYCKDCEHLQEGDACCGCLAPDNLVDSWYGLVGKYGPEDRNQDNDCEDYLYRFKNYNSAVSSFKVFMSRDPRIKDEKAVP